MALRLTCNNLAGLASEKATVPVVKIDSKQPPACPCRRPVTSRYCRSYSPLPVFFKIVNPAFLASENESGLSLIGELKVEMILRTGFLQAGQWVNSTAL